MSSRLPPSAPSLGPLTGVVDTTLGVASAVAFGALSGLRRARFFHPVGDAFEATLDVRGTRDDRWGVRLLDEEARHRCVVRFSRGAGAPAPLPDVLGLALRVLDAHGPGEHQDLLLVTSAAAPVLRNALVPVRHFSDGHYSSVLPYRVDGSPLLFGARPLLSPGTPPPRDFQQLADVLAAGRLRFDLEVAPTTGAWSPVGVLEVGRRLGELEAESLRFNPFTTGGGIEPSGLLQTLRRRTYAASQATRPTRLP